MSEGDAYGLDARAVGRSFDRASAQYDDAAVLQKQVREELLDRLQLVAFEPRVVVDLGCGTAHATRALRDRYRAARVVAIDLAPRMLAAAKERMGWFRRFDRVQADATRLPLRAGCVDLLYSSLMLQWAPDLDAAFAEVRRVLAPRGYFTFTTFGPDTLGELRAAWAEVDDYVHVNRFVDMHEVGDALVRAGLADPVMDVERITVTYADVRGLMRDLKSIGAHNVAAGRPPGLTGPGRLRKLEAAYERFRRDGRLPATYEVVYGQAWAPGHEPPKRARRGEATIDVGSIGRRQR
ncbi:MAG: malonyl-ACP O-methyltransferase BioC [Steroidobacteraceae bacterium]|nr:malonyl-ACP O-methyltransferase BioC [Steroidobacteraceae bacterium]